MTIQKTLISAPGAEKSWIRCEVVPGRASQIRASQAGSSGNAIRTIRSSQAGSSRDVIRTTRSGLTGSGPDKVRHQA